MADETRSRLWRCYLQTHRVRPVLDAARARLEVQELSFRQRDPEYVERRIRPEPRLEKVDDSEYGKFGWIIPEGNKVELWQPPPGQ